VVAVGSSYEDPANYPKGVPYVATDNFKLVKLAHDHLIEAGLPRLAMYSLPESPGNRWAQEREKAFARLVSKGNVYRGGLSRYAAANSLQDQRRQDAGVPDQQLHAAGPHHHRALSLPVAGRALLQWIKQHLRIKTFFGNSENAVKSQVWIAVSVYVLVAIVRKRLQLDASLYETLQILSLTMFETTPLHQLLTLDPLGAIPPEFSNQLNLFES
jgi:hypothetical protein